MIDPMHSQDPESRFPRLDILETIQHHWRTFLVVTITVTAIVAVLGFLYLVWWQPTRHMWSMEFRPVFAGAAQARYPNGLPFSPSDITASSVVDEVFETNDVKAFCSAEQFRSGFFVDQRSSEAALLDLQYRGLLADNSLNPVEQERIVAEYRSRRDALPLHYRLVFFRPKGCEAMPAAVVPKLMNDVLSIWANESEARRGVLNVRVQLLSASSLDVGSDVDSRLVRADLVRVALRRLEYNVQRILEMPGAEMIRAGTERVTFGEVQLRIRDLVRARLEPLMIAAGRGLGQNSASWVNEALATALNEQKIAEQRAQSYREALREYSGVQSVPGVPGGESGQTPNSGSDVQTLTPQIDGTFIDRILALSQQNTAFRQEMAREMVAANIAAVETQADAHYYRRLDQAMRSGAPGLSPEVIDGRLSEIIDEGKRWARQLNELYDQFSRVSLRGAAMLYQIEVPVQGQVLAPFSKRDFMLLVAGAFVVSLLLAFALCWVRERLLSAAPSQVNV